MRMRREARKLRALDRQGSWRAVDSASMAVPMPMIDSPRPTSALPRLAWSRKPWRVAWRSWSEVMSASASGR